jgi:hypothetical protein
VRHSSGCDGSNDRRRLLLTLRVRVLVYACLIERLLSRGGSRTPAPSEEWDGCVPSWDPRPMPSRLVIALVETRPDAEQGADGDDPDLVVLLVFEALGEIVAP